MAADLNYLSSEHPLHSERTTASGKMFGDFANGSVAVYSGYPGQEFLRKPRFFYRSVEQSAQQSIDFPSCRVGCEFHHHHDFNCAAGGCRKFPYPSAASTGPHNTTEELAECGLIIVGRMSEMSRVAMSVHAGRPPGRRPQKTSPQSRQGQGLETRNESGSRSIVSVEADMSDHQREIYHSENGDRWWLCRDDGRVFVLHRANVSSGGTVTKIELGDFLGAGKAGPEHQALIRLIGSLVESG
jgi:hypothetical protein